MNKHHGSSLDELLDDLGEREEVEALAAKKVLAIQAVRRMKQLGLTKTQLATKMHTSRNQLLRVLDEHDAGITLKMLYRLSSALSLPLRLGFEAPKENAKPAAPRRAAAKKRLRELPGAPKAAKRSSNSA